MPIYMDRHDVSEGVTAEMVAHLHQEDLKVQDQFGCKAITYWFDEGRKTAFCLVEAPNEQALQAMHNQAHGELANQIIEVNPSIVESFLGRIEDPACAQNTALNIINDPAFRTIVRIDLTPSDQKGKEQDISETALNKYADAVYQLLLSHGEAPVKQGHDHFLLSFVSVSAAVKTALAVQALIHRLSKDSAQKFEIKIGISAGVPVTGKKSFFEDAIKRADEMCEWIKGEIIVSPDARDLYNSENRDHLIDGENIVALTRADETFLSRLMVHIEAAWRSVDLKVEDFTRPVGCSKSQLYRKMIQLTGRSPNSFINDYRLKRAYELLKNGENTVSEIAFETGFSSPSYFSKCFQKKYGCLPSDLLPLKSS